MSMLLLTKDLEQGTEEWKLARVGHITASRFADAIAKTRTGWGASRANYMAELICEQLTGEPYPQYSSPAMAWGSQCEPAARAAYSYAKDCDVITAGFIKHPHIEDFGCSPDGFVGTDGLVEIKCPNSATHIDTLLRGVIPGDYITQMMAQMSVTGRRWCDWVSFDPRLPLRMQLYVRRVERDDKLIAIMEQQALEFLAELADKVGALCEDYPEA
jgi:putative phage-type endonuclease